MTKETYYDNDFYDTQVCMSYFSANKILPFVFQYISPKSVIDIGCGRGAWLAAFKELYNCSVTGLDGDYVELDKALINADEFIAWDLEKKIDIGKKFDLAVSLEVAEHLCAERGKSFVEDLTRLSDFVLFSAAIPNQPGSHHVNLRTPEYWIEQFRCRKYICFDCIRPNVWNDTDIDPWYQNNMYLFVKESRRDSLNPDLMKFIDEDADKIHEVHPRLLKFISVYGI